MQGVDWENMTNKELHDKFQQIMSGQVQDVLNRFEQAMEKLDGMEKTSETKLDNKFAELLSRFPPPPPAAPAAPLQQQQQHRLPPRQETALCRASRVPLQSGQTAGAAVDTSMAPTANVEEEEDDYVGDYEDEVDQNQNYVPPPAQQPPGRPHGNNGNGRAHPQLRDHDHLPKLKLNIPPFEGRYVPDIYLTWELETGEIMRMRLIKIRTTCHHQRSNHQVVHMEIMAMVGLTLSYEIMTISLN